MPETKPENKPPKEKSKISIEDNDSEAVKNKGVNFLSGALLVVLVVAAIGSFSIVAMELGEIKRLVGLKESTGKEIKENETKISSLKESISKLVTDKLSAEEASSRANLKRERFEFAANAWEESFKRFKKAVSDSNDSLQEIKRLNIKLNSENNSLSATLSEQRTQKSLLETQIKDLKLEKEELNPALIASKKEERDNIEAQKQLAEEAKEQAEEQTIALEARISVLEEKKKDLLAEKFKNEELAKLITREQAKLDDIKASILTAEKSMEDKIRLEAQIANLEKRKKEVLAEKIKNEELAKSALSDLTTLKGESAAKLEEKIESEARHSYLVKENSRLRSERDALTAEILKLNKDYGRWVEALKRAKAQNQSNQ